MTHTATESVAEDGHDVSVTSLLMATTVATHSGRYHFHKSFAPCYVVAVGGERIVEYFGPPLIGSSANRCNIRR